MPRYFIDIAYDGKNYQGLQKQHNANSVESTLSNSLSTYYKKNIWSNLTCASRTDAGVHATQNFFHIDFENSLVDILKDMYHINAILPLDIVIQNISPVVANAHARFDARQRCYEYSIHPYKNPFKQNCSLYYPYPLDKELLQEAAKLILQQKTFTSFCKKHAQNYTYDCTIFLSQWVEKKDALLYEITANRFLRGMIRALVGTMLLVGRKKITLEQFQQFFIQPQLASADFSPQAKGLCLTQIIYPASVFISSSN